MQGISQNIEHERAWTNKLIKDTTNGFTFLIDSCTEIYWNETHYKIEIFDVYSVVPKEKRFNFTAYFDLLMYHKSDPYDLYIKLKEFTFYFRCNCMDLTFQKLYKNKMINI